MKDFNLGRDPLFVSGKDAEIVRAAELVERQAVERAQQQANGAIAPMVFYETETERSIMEAKFTLEKRMQAENNLALPPILLTEATPALPAASSQYAVTSYPARSNTVTFHRLSSKPPTDMELTVMLLVKIVLRRIGETVYLYDNEGYYKKLSSVQLRTLVLAAIREELSVAGQAKQIDNVVKLILAEPTIEVHNQEQMNRYLCVRNGILDLYDGTLLPHSPNFFVTSQIQADWLGPQNCPTCDYFFASVARGDTELIQRLWEVLGFLLVPDNNAKRFVLLQGVGDSGKSAFSQLACLFFTQDVVTAVDIFKMGDRFTPSTLVSARLNVSSDLSSQEISPLAISVIKQITGNDRITVEEKYKSPYSAIIQAKLLYGTNHQIRGDNLDPAFLRRILYVPFKYAVPKEQQIHDLPERLRSELSGILYKAIVAYKNVVANNYRFTGDDTYDMVKADQCGDISASVDDSLNEFITTHCISAPGSFVPTEVLQECYNRFCLALQKNGIVNRQIFSARFSKAITQYFPEVRNKKARVGNKPYNGYEGIMIQ